MKHYLYCFSKCDFENYCQEQGWNDGNIPRDCAFISICGTPDCQKYYLDEVEEHYFRSGPQVLNLDFDDIATDSVEWKGHIFYGLSNLQAAQAVRFIEKNIDKNFYIHCRAGQSRSQGFVRFIQDMYPGILWTTRDDNPCNTPNMDVVCKLKEQYRLLGYYTRDILGSFGFNAYKVEFYDGLGVEESEYTYQFEQSVDSIFNLYKLHYFPDEELINMPYKAEIVYSGYNKVVKEFKTLNDLLLFLDTECNKKQPHEKE